MSLYKKRLQELRQSCFLDPEATNAQTFIDYFRQALELVVDARVSGPVCSARKDLDSLVESDSSVDPCGSISALAPYLAGAVNSGHPYLLKNIIPTVSLPSLAASCAISVLQANAVTGDDTGELLGLEAETIAKLSSLVGFDRECSGGVFTFGGTGTNLYALKVALTKIDPMHRVKGISGNCCIIESKASHYSHQTAIDWLGIGSAQCYKANTKPDQSVDLVDLERQADAVLSSGKKLVCIIASGGTTAGMGIDDISGICELRNKLTEKYQLNYTPHIHVDFVLGWAFLCFNEYDFFLNPLEFSQAALEILKTILNKLQAVKLADSFGVDFHKTGFTALTSSAIVFKQKSELALLQKDVTVTTPLFHELQRTQPGKYTLETSRSVAPIVGAWMSLKLFYKVGYQVLLGHCIEMAQELRRQIQAQLNGRFVIVNQETLGPDVYLRCYVPTLSPEKCLMADLEELDHYRKSEKYFNQFSTWLLKNAPYSDLPLALSKSSACIYSSDGYPITGLRIYILNPFIDDSNINEIIKRLSIFKKEFDRIYLS